MHIKTYAKLNLYLKVFPLRPDGYHDLISVMQTIDLADEMTFTTGGDGIRIKCDYPGVPADENNIVAKVYRLLSDEFPGKVGGVEVVLNKRIPPGSGLAGGSGNAAGALAAFRKLFDLAIDHAEMVKLASRAGSDIPFLLRGGCAMVSGRGERVEKLPGVIGAYYLVVAPGIEVGTADAYGVLDGWRVKEHYEAAAPADIFPLAHEAWLSSIASGEFEVLLHNDFEEPIFAHRPEIAAVMDKFRKIGVSSHMTGSGSAVFAIVSDYNRALEIMEPLKDAYGDGVFFCQPVDKGVEIYD